MSAQPDIPIRRHQSPSRWGVFRRRLILGAVALVTLLVLGFVIWSWVALHYTYSSGQRIGYIQKMSKKGWVCKTWEGELAMLNQPGVPAQIFNFTVSDEGVAQSILRDAGQRVRLTYSQHRGVPSTCFGETEYFITAVSPVGP